MKSSLITSISFYFLALIFLLLISPVPILGNLATAAFHFGSPFTWVLIASGENDGFISKFYMLGYFIPHAILGLIFGYIWPMQLPLGKSSIKQLLKRFFISCICLLILGCLASIWVVAHDS